MPSNPLTELLKLPPEDRAVLAMSLWASLSDDERDEQLELSEADQAELDRRWAEHVSDPDGGDRGPWFARSFAAGEALEQLVERIAEMLSAYPRVRGATQRTVLRRFFYAVDFRVATGSDVVLSIHGRQHPSHWQRRR